MNKDDIRMAREAGFRAGHIELYNSDPMPFVAPCSATDCMPELVRFAAIVAATQREECAALESWAFSTGKPLPDYLLERLDVALAVLRDEVL